MPLTFGPARISANRQVALPKRLMDQLHLTTGDDLYFIPDDDVPSSFLVIPAEALSQWVDSGLDRARDSHRERLNRESSAPPA
jgi:bifunctional DNA-binding transcriptional regulator/antitoxin component of YhaV-PrlF toxin-antitoxin module